MRSALIFVLVIAAGAEAHAHRLDEYLQAATIGIEKDRIQIQLDLTPGVAVSGYVLSTIDADRDGVISNPEQQAYAQRVMADVALSLDGEPLRPRLVSMAFPPVEDLNEGLGSIRLELAADASAFGASRTLVFDNRHMSPIASYLVNCLKPSDGQIRVKGQDRNYEQSHYQVEYMQAGLPDGWAWLTAAALLLIGRLAYLGHHRRGLL